MSGWAAYLPPVASVTDGCAIISLQGARCGTQGKWQASTAEEQNYAALLNDPASAQSKGLTYGGKKYIITRALDDTIMAQLGKNGLYNDYLPGQRIYVDCRDLELGMYGYKGGSGNGMVQIGFNNGGDDTYETSYIESSILIDSHVFKGEVEDEVEPIVGAITPVPGGVGSVTTSVLATHVVKAAERMCQ